MARFIVLALIAAAVVWAATEGRRRWLVHQLRAAADRHGHRAEPGRRPLPRRFDIPGSARGSTADLALVDPASGATVFRHRHRSRGSDQPIQEDLHVLVPLRFNSPHVLLRPPTMANRIGSRLGLGDTEIADHDVTRRLGIVDVETGHESFDRTFQVSTDDERFVRRLVDGRSATELIRRAEFDGVRLRFEFFGPWLLISGPDHTIDRAALMLGWMRGLPDLIGSEVVESHPPPAEPVDPWQ